VVGVPGIDGAAGGRHIEVPLGVAEVGHHCCGRGPDRRGRGIRRGRRYGQHRTVPDGDRSDQHSGADQGTQPGFLKNAIDWASRPANDIPHVFGDLPVALIGAGGGAGTRFAQNAWLSVFRFLKMRPWFGQSLYLDRAQERLDEHNRLIDEATREQLLAVMTGFAAHCAQLPRVRPS
jgi:NADPH-dependent FMN reductase